MAPEDKGLVLRGLALLAFIAGIVALVLAIIFWRPQPAAPTVAIMADRAPSAPGWEIRYNAAATLARRGSAQVPWALMREMLDEKQQMCNNQTRLPDGQAVYDEAAARSNMVSALRALAAWHEKQSPNTTVPPELRAIYVVVDQLAESSIVELKEQARKTRGTFFREKS
jgi:hypothetical protein